MNGQKITGITIEDFEKRLMAVRMGALKWGSARIEAIFKDKINKQYPAVLVNGRAIECSQDFCDVIKLGPWDNTLRGMVSFAQHEMWGDSNQDSVNLEHEFREIIRVKFTGYLSNGEPPKKLHKGRCFSQLFVKVKNMMIGKIRNTCKRRWREAVYSRKEDPSSHARAGAGAGKEGIPQLKYQKIATTEEDGFHGKLGIFEGSPRENEEGKVVLGKDEADAIGETAPVDMLMPSPTDEPNGANLQESDVEQWLAKQSAQTRNALIPMLQRLLNTQQDSRNKRTADEAFCNNQMVSLRWTVCPMV